MNFVETFGFLKLESLGYRVALFAFSRFDTMAACDGRTDGQTDGRAHDDS